MKPTKTIAMLLLATGLSACQDRPATQAVISVATDIPTQEMNRIDFLLERYNEEINDYVDITQGITNNWQIGPSPAYQLPGSLVTYSGAAAEPKLRVTVHAFSSGNGQRMLRRQVVFKLVKEKTLFMRVGLTQRCFQDADCPSAKTCIEGRCKDIEYKSLPEYDPARQPELTVACDSGTRFINTTTGAPLEFVPNQRCPGDDVCIEGVCYPANVFGAPLSAAPQPVTLNVVVSDQSGMAPMGPLQLRAEDGPVSLVRKLRDAGFKDPVTPPASVTGAGPHAVNLQADPLTTELRLTVSGAMYAPQVVAIPYRPGVRTYNVPVVLLRMEERAATPGPLPLVGGGRMATLTLPPGTPAGTIRYALMDGRYLPGQAVVSTAGGLLQSVAVLYLEYVNRNDFPPGTSVTLAQSSTPFVFGTGGGAGAFLLDLQGQWKQPMGAVLTDSGGLPRLAPKEGGFLEGGFWAVANHTAAPGCVRGRLIRPGNVPCAGVQVRLLGPEGVSSSDFSDGDGRFCGLAAQREAAILAVGNNTSTIFVPPTGAVGASCSASTEACTDVGDRLVSEADCLQTPVLAAARKAVGETCNNTLECAGLASCHGGYCVSESYVRVSMEWGVQSDFDLHLKLPDGKLVNHENPVAPGVGRLDVQQCTRECPGTRHVESIVLGAGAPQGTYEVWVKNYGGQAPGNAIVDIFVDGRRRPSSTTVTVPPTPLGDSSRLTFTLP